MMINGSDQQSSIDQTAWVENAEMQRNSPGVYLLEYSEGRGPRCLGSDAA
jgi:hypothetical protein